MFAPYIHSVNPMTQGSCSRKLRITHLASNPWLPNSLDARTQVTHPSMLIVNFITVARDIQECWILVNQHETHQIPSQDMRTLWSSRDKGCSLPLWNNCFVATHCIVLYCNM